MTAAELKKIIAEVPDSAEITFHINADGSEPISVKGAFYAKKEDEIVLY